MFFEKVAENRTSNETDFKNISNVKAVIKETLLETTAHGLPHIIKRENIFLKVFWLMCFLASASACGFMVYTAIDDYLSWDAVSKVEIIQQIPTPFPAVSICNINSFKDDNVSNAFIYNLLLENGLIALNLTFEQMYSDWFRDRILVLKYFVGTNALSNKLNKTMKQMLGLTLEDMMMSCLYNLQPCWVNDFEWYFDIFYGNCWKFNSGKNSSGHQVPDKMSTKSGKINGLQLELLVSDSSDMSYFSTSRGIHVNVHNKSNFAFFYEGVDVATGTETNIMIRREVISKLADPYSECIDNIESRDDQVFAKMIKQSNITYRQSDCFDYCFQNFVIEKCGCYDSSISY